MAKMIKLKSGSRFYYEPATKTSAAYAVVITEDNNIVGGFLEMEAERKYKAFYQLQKESHSVAFPDLSNVEVSLLKDKLGSAIRLLSQALAQSKFADDSTDADGTGSKAQSCDERKTYYNVVGCSRLFKSSIKFPVWALILNHLAIFSNKNFRETFMRGKEVEEVISDDNFGYYKSRYSEEDFKAPAYYIRSLLMS